MTGGSRIVAIGNGTAEAAEADHAIEGAADAAPAAADDSSWDEEEPIQRPARGWILPSLAILAIAGWSSFFAWANLWAIGGVTPQQGVSLLTSWAVPVLLIGVLWLIAMRNSRREALRFGDTAGLLSAESARLEQRLLVVNQELSLAREFLASQSRELETVGRTASEKLSFHAEHLQSLVSSNAAQIESIASVSASALDNMEKLRGQMPVLASSAKDVTNNIGNAGRTAQVQLRDLIDGFKRINEFGKASEVHVEDLRTRIDTAVEFLGARLDDLRDRAETRFAELNDRSAAFRDQLGVNEDQALAAIRARSTALLEELGEAGKALEGHEADSVAGLRERLGTLRFELASAVDTMREGGAATMDDLATSRDRFEASVQGLIGRLEALDQQMIEGSRARVVALVNETEAFDAHLTERNRRFDAEALVRVQQASEAQASHVEAVSALISDIDASLSERIAAHSDHARTLSEQGDAFVARAETAAGQIATLAAQAGHAEGALGNSLHNLTAHLTGSREALGDAAGAVTRLTDDSVRLLELLQASSEQSRAQLPEAIAAGEARLIEIEARIAALQDGITSAASRADDLAESLSTSRSTISQSLGEIGALQAGLEQGTARHGHLLDDLRASLEQLDSESTRLATASRDDLSQALAKLTDATRDAGAALEQAGERTIATLTEKLGAESVSAIEQILQARTAEAVGTLEEAADRAAGVSRESAVQLRDQLAKIDALAGNLERRVAQTRAQAEDQVDNDFSRRVALITESLNSNAIDIAKALSSDVTDTAWASYLRGDRGVFTRRAVRLLETQEARSIAQIYGEDREFREHVSHYIHDFEAMLRQLLATRDGHALSVTLLSSDMGKLYVALAQAIERLRD